MRGRKLSPAAALAAVLLLGNGVAHAAEGSPDCFGYTWADQCSFCEQDIPAFGPAAETFPGVTDVVGPVELPFLFRWYGRPATQVWIAPSGYVTFSDQGPNVGTRQTLPDPNVPNDLLAVMWLKIVDADITVEATPESLHVQWTVRWVTDPTRPWVFHLLLFPDGSIRTHWPATWGQLYATVGYEDAAGDCGRLLFEGDPENFETYEDEGTFPTPAGDNSACISPPTLLACDVRAALRCGQATNALLPGLDPTPTSVHACDPGEWAATERAFEFRVDELADVRVTLTPSAGQQLKMFRPEACDEWACRDADPNALTVQGLSPGDQTVLIVDGQTAGVDDGAFTLDVECTPISRPLVCGATAMDSTAGGFARLDQYACLPGDFSGFEVYYTVDVTTGDTIELALTSGLGHGVFVFDAALPLQPEFCLTGGAATAWVPNPAPGSYLVVVDGPAGAEGAFELELNCSPRLTCAPGPAPIGCNESVSGSTAGQVSSVASYGCALGAYAGGEAVHVFDNPVRQVVTFQLDDAAEPGLDIILLDSCNEEACLAVADNQLSIELDPGFHHVVIDGPVAGGDYTLSTLCGQGIRPDFISVSRSEGECFTEHKTVWMTPEVPPIDILFSIDLSGSMIPERAELAANIIDVIDRLPDFLPDVAVGLVSHRDYYYPCLGWGLEPCRYVPSDFGQPGDWPYRLHHPITKDHEGVLQAAESLPPADFGGTSGEAYNRVMYEAVNDPNIGWRPGARRMLVTIGDDVPHDCDLASCFGGPPLQRGIDLGPDGLPDSGDELATMDVLQGLIDSETILLHLDSSGGQGITGIPYVQFWQCWAERTGGRAEEINDDGTIPDDMDVARLIADLVSRRQACDRLELVASPGYEEWLTSDGGVQVDVELPIVAGFDIEICVPAGTPPGVHQFEVQALCDGELVAAQQVEVSVGACGAVVDEAPSDQAICPEDTVELDGSGVTLENCEGDVEYWWHEGPDLLADTPTVLVGPSVTTTYDFSVTCSTDPACTYLDAVTVTLIEGEPDGVYATLRARHEGDEVTFHWDAARDLLPGEHFHLLKTSEHPTNVFSMVNPESDLNRWFTETDVSSWVQFFDLRVATQCEVQSVDEFPPTHP